MLSNVKYNWNHYRPVGQTGNPPAPWLVRIMQGVKVNPENFQKSVGFGGARPRERVAQHPGGAAAEAQHVLQREPATRCDLRCRKRGRPCRSSRVECRGSRVDVPDPDPESDSDPDPDLDETLKPETKESGRFNCSFWGKRSNAVSSELHRGGVRMSRIR